MCRPCAGHSTPAGSGLLRLPPCSWHCACIQHNIGLAQARTDLCSHVPLPAPCTASSLCVHGQVGASPCGTGAS